MNLCPNCGYPFPKVLCGHACPPISAYEELARLKDALDEVEARLQQPVYARHSNECFYMSHGITGLANREYLMKECYEEALSLVRRARAGELKKEDDSK